MRETMQESITADLAARGLPYQPLDRMVTLDTFESHRSGWYGHHIDRPGYDVSWGVICRSSMTAHRWGSYGAQSGHYSLKLATRPTAGDLTRAIKRMTTPYHGGAPYPRLRFETVFTFHEEPRGAVADTEIRPDKPDLTGESTVRGFTVEFDVHDRAHRFWPAIRYANWDGEDRQARWEYNPAGIDPTMDRFEPIPDGDQDLCWNSPNDSVPWKPNWHYLRIDLDLADRSYRELQCNDVVLDLGTVDLDPADPYHDDERTTPWPDIDGLFNPIMSVQTNADTRSFLFVDSLVISAAEEP